VAGVDARPLVVTVPVTADEHPHRHEHDLEGEEEEHRVASREGRERPSFDEQQAAEEGGGRTPRGDLHPRVRGDERSDDRGEDDERGRDAVDAEGPAHPDLGEP
jgi:hypothetical protein